MGRKDMGRKDMGRKDMGRKDMGRKDKAPQNDVDVGRRKFMAGVALTGAATAVVAQAQCCLPVLVAETAPAPCRPRCGPTLAWRLPRPAL